MFSWVFGVDIPNIFFIHSCTMLRDEIWMEGELHPVPVKFKHHINGFHSVFLNSERSLYTQDFIEAVITH